MPIRPHHEMTSHHPPKPPNLKDVPIHMYRSSFRSLSTSPKAHWEGLGVATPGRGIWGIFTILNERCSYCAACEPQNCWGSTILRVSYKDDVCFAQAVETIRRLAGVPVDYDQENPPRDPTYRPDARRNLTREEMDDYSAMMDRNNEANWKRVVEESRELKGIPEASPLSVDAVANDELKRHFHCIKVEDQEALDGATPDTAGEYFLEKGYSARESGPRSAFFMYLDEETIGHLAGAPTDEEFAQMSVKEKCKVARQHWVKIVQPLDEDIDEPGYERVEPDALRIASMRRRVRLLDLLDLYLEATDLYLEEMGNEGDDHKPPTQVMTDHWCFVGSSNFRSEWMEE